MQRIAIRVSSDPSTGKGHFERCKVIRSYLKYEVTWVLDKKNLIFEKSLPHLDSIIFEKNKESCNKLKEIINYNDVQFILVDNYFVSNSDINFMNIRVPVVLISDAKTSAKVSLIICPQPNISIVKNRKTKLLVGYKYVPVNKKFYKINNYKENNLNKNILVSMGSIDSLGVTLKVIQGLKNIIDKIEEIKVDIVLGQDSTILDLVNNSINNYNNFVLHVEPSDMSIFYEKSYIAVGAPGFSFSERLASGLPSIIIPQNSVHEDIASNCVKLGCAITSKNNIRSIEKNLKMILNNEKYRNNISFKGLDLVDGKGGLRIAQNLSRL